MATLMQKAALLITPAAAIGLAWFLAEDVSKASKRPHLTWRAKAAKPAAAPAAPGDGTPAGAPAAAPGEGAPKPPSDAPKTPKPADPPPKKPSPAPAEGGAKPKPAAAGDGPAVEFLVPGSMRLPPHASAPALRDATANREDVIIKPDGTLMLHGKWTAPEALKDALAGSAKREGGLVYLVADVRAPWDRVRDAAASALAAGFGRVGLAVTSHEAPGIGRCLPLPPAPGEAAGDATVIRVGEGATGATFDVGGEAFDSAGDAMREHLKAFHEDYALDTPDYAKSVDTTRWTVDGAGATTLGVVQALEALAAAGAPVARLAGLTK